MIRVVSGVAVISTMHSGGRADVAGIPIEHGALPLVLMGRRKATGMRPDLWELPGGKVEPGEASKVALGREWREELGVEIEVGELVTAAVLEVESSILVELYHVKFEGTPRPLDHAELRWVSLGTAVRFMPCSPGLYLHYRALRDWIFRTLEVTP